MEQRTIDLIFPEYKRDTKDAVVFIGEMQYPVKDEDRTHVSYCFDKLQNYEPPKDKNVFASLGVFSQRFWTDKDKKVHSDTKFLYCNKLFIDLDGRDHTKVLDYDLASKTLAPEILSALDRARIPRPGLIMYTGHGLHLYWLLDNEENQDRWKFGAKALKQSVKPVIESNPLLNEYFELDMVAGSAPINKYRIPESINTKHGDNVKVTILFFDEEQRFKTEDLLYRLNRPYVRPELRNPEKYDESKMTPKQIERLYNERLKLRIMQEHGAIVDLPEPKPVEKKPISQKEKQVSQTKKDTSLAGKQKEKPDTNPARKESSFVLKEKPVTEKRKGVKNTKSAKTLNRTRLDDLYRLQSMRNFADIKTGYRASFMFIFCTTERLLTEDYNTYMKEVFKANHGFNEPLSDREAQDIATCVWNKASKKTNWTNERIIDTLHITENEMKNNKTIISKEMAKKRKAEAQTKKRQAEKEAKQAEKQKRDDLILNLLREGLSTRSIVERMKELGYKVSKSTINRVSQNLIL